MTAFFVSDVGLLSMDFFFQNLSIFTTAGVKCYVMVVKDSSYIFFLFSGPLQSLISLGFI